MTDMWDFFSPEPLQWYRWRLDGAEAWLRKNGEEWRLALCSVGFRDIEADSGGPEKASPHSDLEVSFGVGLGSRVALRPRLSEIPYLIMVRNHVRLLPGSEASFSIALPPLLRFELEGGKVLLEGQPFKVSQTWFGDKTAGNLCLSLPMSLDPQCAGEQQDAAANTPAGSTPSTRYTTCRSLVQCRLVVRNASKEPVDLDRFAIFTDMINIYLQGDRLVTDTVTIIATQDGSLQTRIEKSPASLPILQPAARSGTSEFLLKRGVSFLKSIAGLQE